MRTVLFFEWTRKKKECILRAILPVVFILILFIGAVLVEKIYPEFNYNYMRWPDRIKEYLCIPNWSLSLYMNIWQIFALVYPVCLYYVLMNEMTCSILEEERLETMVYLHNAGVSKKEYMGAKLIFWLGQLGIACVMMLLINILLVIMVNQAKLIVVIINYFLCVFSIGILYLAITLFFSSYKRGEQEGMNAVLNVLLFPLLISRIPTVLSLFSWLLCYTGRSEEISLKLANLGQSLEGLEMIAPVVWCWPAMEITLPYGMCIVCIIIIMIVAAFAIYPLKK